MKSRLFEATALLIALFIVIFIMDWICPLEAFCGIPCPGCGMSSAVYHLLRGDIRSAWFFNPALFWLLPFIGFVLLAWLKDKTFFSKKGFRVLFVVGLVGYLLIYANRMITIFPAWPMSYVEGNFIQRMWLWINGL